MTEPTTEALGASACVRSYTLTFVVSIAMLPSDVSRETAKNFDHGSLLLCFMQQAAHAALLKLLFKFCSGHIGRPLGSGRWRRLMGERALMARREPVRFLARGNRVR